MKTKEHVEIATSIIGVYRAADNKFIFNRKDTEALYAREDLQDIIVHADRDKNTFYSDKLRLGVGTDNTHSWFDEHPEIEENEQCKFADFNLYDGQTKLINLVVIDFANLGLADYFVKVAALNEYEGSAHIQKTSFVEESNYFVPQVYQNAVRMAVFNATHGVNEPRMSGVIVTGAPGVGKTSGAVKIAEEIYNADYVVLQPSSALSPDEVIGINYWLNNGTMEYRKNDIFDILSNQNGSDKPLFIIVDELNRITNSMVRAAILHLTDKGWLSVNNIVLDVINKRPYVVFIGTVNHYQEELMTSDTSVNILGDAQRRRFPYTAELTFPDHDTQIKYCQLWGISQKGAESIIEFIKQLKRSWSEKGLMAFPIQSMWFLRTLCLGAMSYLSDETCGYSEQTAIREAIAICLSGHVGFANGSDVTNIANGIFGLGVNELD